VYPCQSYADNFLRGLSVRTRLTATLLILFAAILGSATAASAGSPHVPDTKVTATVDGSTLTVAFKESGLGDESQITVQVTAEAHCVNPGGNDPQAGNKQTFTEQAAVPVQNGRASGVLVLTATFQPACVPPMSVSWDSAVYTDLTNGIVVDLTG
jgi:hypothetical protein